MAIFPRPSTPRALLRDVRAFASGGQRYRLLFAALAICMPAIILYGFYTDGMTNIAPPRSVIYVQFYQADRTDEQIKAQQVIDQKKRDADREEQRQAYQRLADQLGIK